MEFLTTKDIQELTGWSKPTVLKLFARKDFPAITIGRPFIVEKSAFEKWCERRRENI